MKLKICLVGLLCLFFQAHSQSLNAKRALRPGEQVPDVALVHLLNYNHSSTPLSTFRGRLLILDFWSTWCGACINGMPEIARLSKIYGDRIQIVSVTNQSVPVITSFLARQGSLRALHLLMSIGNPNLDSLFPHLYYPHVVWISPDGTYLASTGKTDLNTTVIDQLLSKGHAEFANSKTDDLNYAADRPLFEDGNGGSPQYLYRSLLSRYQPGLPSGQGTFIDSAGLRIRATNMPLKTLLLQGLNVPRYAFPDNRIFVEATVNRELFFSDAKAPASVPLYCYQLQLEKGTKSEANSILLGELERFFHFMAQVESRETECWVLSVVDSALIPSGRIAAVATNNLHDETESRKRMVGAGFGDLVAHLNSIAGWLPVIDETRISSSVDLTFDAADLQTSTAFNHRFKSYGLQLNKQIRRIPVIVIQSTLTSPGTSLLTH